jgi:hypothetical protein
VHSQDRLLQFKLIIDSVSTGKSGSDATWKIMEASGHNIERRGYK